MSTSGILRSEQHAQFMISPDGAMAEMHQAPIRSVHHIASQLLSSGHQALHQAIHNHKGIESNITAVANDIVMETRHAEKDIVTDTKYAEKEFLIFWDAPQSECITLFTVVIALICLDSFIARKVNVASYKVHAFMVTFWIVCGIAYNIHYAIRHGASDGIDWCVGYVLEWMLSVDNLFAFQFIMKAYKAPQAIQHKALFCGVFGAMLWRLLMFLTIGFLMHSIHFVQFFFGFILIYAGVQAVQGDDDEQDPNNMIFMRILKKCLGDRMMNSYDLENHSLFIWDPQTGRLCATLLVPLIFCIEISDLIFAVDSVSAKVAQIPNQYIAYSSSVFALLGLRAMYFVIDDLIRYFDTLKYGVGFILVFIGGELMISGKYQLPDWVVCIVIITVFNFCIVLSIFQKLIWPTSQADEKQKGVLETKQFPEVASDKQKSKGTYVRKFYSPGASSSLNAHDLQQQQQKQHGTEEEQAPQLLSAQPISAGSREPHGDLPAPSQDIHVQNCSPDRKSVV